MRPQGVEDAAPYRLLVQKGACLLQQAGPIRLRND